MCGHFIIISLNATGNKSIAKIPVLWLNAYCILFYRGESMQPYEEEAVDWWGIGVGIGVSIFAAVVISGLFLGWYDADVTGVTIVERYVTLHEPATATGQPF
jgi:hypothetical protein